MCWVDSRTLHQGKGKPKHMAEVNASDNSFFYPAVSVLQRRGMKTDMVETSKVWHPSSPRKPSCRIHLRYTLLSASQTHTRIGPYAHTHARTPMWRGLFPYFGSTFKVNLRLWLLLLFFLVKSRPQYDMQEPLAAGSTEGQQLGEEE